MWLKIIINSKVRCSHNGNFSSSYLTNFRGLLALVFKTRPKLTSSFPAHSLRYRAGVGHVTEHKNDMPEKKTWKKTLWPLVVNGVQLPQGLNHFDEAVYFLPLSSQKFLVLILSTSQGWKTESTLEPPGGFKHETPRFWIQRLNQ